MGDHSLACGDETSALNNFFIDSTLRFEAYQLALRNGEIGSMWEIYREMVFEFKGAGNHNYSGMLMEMFVKYEEELTPDMRAYYESTWVVNESGKAGCWIGADLAQEHDIGQGKVSA